MDGQDLDHLKHVAPTVHFVHSIAALDDDQTNAADSPHLHADHLPVLLKIIRIKSSKRHRKICPEPY